MGCNCLEVALDGATGNPFDIKTLPGIRAELDAIESELEELQQAIEDLEKPSLITDKATGAIATFSDGAAEPLIDLTCQIEPVQDLSGTISGHEGMTLKRTGKNLIPYPYYRPDSRTDKGITYTVNADGSVTANGTATGNSLYEFRHRQDTGDLALTLIPGTYTLSGCPSGGSTGSYQIIANKTQNGPVMVARDVGESATFTVDENITLGVYIQIQSGTTVNNLTFYPQVEVGASKTAYEKYQGDTYNVSWQTEAGEVYGGTLDVTTGLLTIDTWLFEDNGGSGWGVIGNGYRKSLLPYRGVSYSTAKERGNWLKPATAKWENEPGTFAVGSYMNINVSNIAEITDVATLQAYLAEHPLQICYELRDKITYQLTATQVNALLGNNNIWSDTGDTTVEYYADLKAYIDKKIAEIGG